MQVRISLSGCDDTTIVDIDVSEDQKEFLDLLAKLSEAVSTYGCMPTLTVKEDHHPDV